MFTYLRPKISSFVSSMVKWFLAEPIFKNIFFCLVRVAGKNSAIVRHFMENNMENIRGIYHLKLEITS
jgi:hypothetical protein